MGTTPPYPLPARWPVTGTGTLDVLYSEQKNIMISMVCKVGSTSLETWANSKHNTNFLWKDRNSADAIIDTHKPVMISIIRDPLERLASSVEMLCRQSQRAGIEITWENFSCLEHTTDPHLMPQSCFILTEKQHRYCYYDHDWSSDLSIMDQGWIDVFETHNILSSLTDKNVFFLMTMDNNVMEDLAKFIDEPSLALYWKNQQSLIRWETFLKETTQDSRTHLKSTTLRYRSLYPEFLNWMSKTLPKFTDTYLEHAKKVYHSDYQLINHVKFINDNEVTYDTISI